MSDSVLFETQSRFTFVPTMTLISEFTGNGEGISHLILLSVG